MQPHRITWHRAAPWLIALLGLGAIAAAAAFWPAKPTASDVALIVTTAPAPATAPTLVASVAPSATASPSPTPTATSSPTASPTSTATATTTPTATSSPTPTDVPPSVHVEADILNVRTGPGTGYPVVNRARSGADHLIVGRSERGDWWQIDLGDAKGWVFGELVATVGELDTIPVVAVAPPPTPRPEAVAAAASAGSAPQPAGGGFFAAGIQIDPYADRGATIAAVRNLGVGWVKFQLPWKDFEGSPGARNFPDDVVNQLADGGLSMLVSIVKAPAWARPGDTDLNVEGPPANPGDYAGYVGAFAAHYCGRVQAIEVWNEQNLHYEWGNEPLDARRYIQLLAAAYRSIKAACPGMIVVSGAPTPTGALPPAAIRDTLYLEQMYQAGLRNYCDAVGVHPSGYGNPPDVTVQDFQAGNYSRPSHVSDSSFYFRNTMEQYRNIMVKYGDGNKRLWPTEFGWASSGNPIAGYEYAAYNSEQQQGEYVARSFQMMRNWGFVGVAFLWNLNYNVTSPGTELAAFGILGRSSYGILQAAPK